MINTTMKLKNLLFPRSIAIVGESRPPSVGNRIVRLKNHSYKGEVYPVNPKYDEICGYKCYHSVSELPEGIDNAIIRVRNDLVIPIVRQCIDKKIKSFAVISGGFAEIGPQGKDRQAELIELLKKYEIPLLGPNCIGYANFHKNIIAFGNSKLKGNIKGSVAFLTQSGGLGSIANRAQEKQVGFSFLVSTGNEAILEVSDFINFIAEDDNTQIIMIFLECIRNVPNFIQAAKKALQFNKPIIVLKAGKTEVAKQASIAHTAALIGKNDAYDALFKQFGIVSVQDIDELIDTAILFSDYKMPDGNGLGILGVSGGASVLLADHADQWGFALPKLPRLIKDSLSVLKFGTPMNPLDLTGQVAKQPEIFDDILKLFANEKTFDSIIATITPDPENVNPRTDALIKVKGITEKPVVVFYTGLMEVDSIRLMRKNKIAVFESAEKCMKNLSNMVWYAKKIRALADESLKSIRFMGARVKMQQKIDDFMKKKIKTLSELELSEILMPYSIPFPSQGLARSWNECKALVQRIGYPVVVKALSRDIAHKTDMNCLEIGIEDSNSLKKAYDSVIDNAKKHTEDIEGVLVQEMVMDGIEVIFGINHDPLFGPVMMLGLGGIYAELISDVTFRLPPLTELDIKEMLSEIKTAKLLYGFRGQPKRDIESLIDVINRLSQFAFDWGNIIKAMDLNPILVLPEGKGCKAVDGYLEFL